jgi:dynein assembly factor 5
MAEEESQYAQLSMKFQRDINCISDPDRNVRRRALDKLSRSLKNDTASVSNNVLQNLFTKNLKAPLLNCITSDNVEKCREKSLNILTLFAEKNAIPHSEEALKDLVQMLNARMGKLPYSEPTEEIRFLSLQFLWTYLKHRVDVGAEKKGTLLNVIPDLANVLGKASVDPFPDVKKVTADLTILISKNWPNDMRLQLATIAKPMVTNIGHQHSRVRVCALSALEALIPCGAETLPELMNDILIPALTKVIFDRTPSVRKQFVLLVATWFKEITIIKQFQTTLLPFLLAGMTDESPEVQQITHIKLEELSSKWEQEQADSTEIEPMAIDEDGSTFPGAANVPFKTRTPRGARLLASSIISEVIPALLEKTCDWTVQTREKYTKILSIFLALVENNMNPFLDKIFTALAKTCRDDEDIVIKSVKECMNIVGHYADSQMVLASLLPMVAGRLAGQDTAQHRTNGLTLLGMTVEGMTLKTIEAHLDAITEALCDNGVRESENAELQDQLAGVVSSVLHTSGPLIIQKDLYSFRLFWILNHLLSSSNESSLAYEKALDCVQELAAKSSINVEKLYQKFLGKLLEQMQLPSDPKKTWKKNDPSRVLFDSLCRRAGAACADNVNTIIPVFLLHLDPAQDADVRLAFLALLESMLGTDSIAQV